MAHLSVNINKIALIRNSRKGNLPDLYQIARDCEDFGAQGITVHPRPDERHIRYADIPVLKQLVRTEFNIEGNPTEDFLQLVLDNRPTQCTLVPDAPGVLTSSEGWDTTQNASFLKEVISRLQGAGIRVSVFVDPVEQMVVGAKAAGADRIEFYTGDYALRFAADRKKAIEPFVRCAAVAQQIDIGVNAGHDLNLDNLRYFKQEVAGLLEVSIGHALVSDALYYGLKNTIQLYLKELR